MNFILEEFPEDVSQEDLNDLKKLLWEYYKDVEKLYSGKLCTCYTNFEEDLDNLPGKYKKKERGSIIVCRNTESKEICGCVLIKKEASQENHAELTKLYVRPKYRGNGLGKKLVSKCIESSISLNYDFVVLATNTLHEAAIRLYKKNKFVLMEKGFDHGCTLTTVVCYILKL